MITKLRPSKEYKNASSHIIFLIYIKLINEESTKTKFWRNFVNRKELQEYIEYLITLIIQRTVEIFNRTVQNHFSSAKDRKKEKYNLKESYNEFVIYNSDRENTQL